MNHSNKNKRNLDLDQHSNDKSDDPVKRSKQNEDDREIVENLSDSEKNEIDEDDYDEDGEEEQHDDDEEEPDGLSIAADEDFHRGLFFNLDRFFFSRRFFFSSSFLLFIEWLHQHRIKVIIIRENVVIINYHHRLKMKSDNN